MPVFIGLGAYFYAFLVVKSVFCELGLVLFAAAYRQAVSATQAMACRKLWCLSLKPVAEAESVGLLACKFFWKARAGHSSKQLAFYRV